MFEALSDRFGGIFKRLRNSGRLTEAEVDEVLREIRVALLEADVNVRVVRSLQARIRERCVGVEVGQALTSAQFVIKVVNEELTTTLGGETISITYASKPPTVVLMAGLQGSGKTTTSAKLARWFKAQGRQPLLVGADLQRPAAVEQLLEALVFQCLPFGPSASLFTSTETSSASCAAGETPERPPHAPPGSIFPSQS